MYWWTMASGAFAAQAAIVSGTGLPSSMGRSKYAGGRVGSGDHAAAEASIEQSRIALQKVQAQVAADVAVAEAAYREAHARWVRYRGELEPKSAKVREAVAYAYEKGGASLVDLLTAQRDDNSVRLAMAQAMSDTVTAAADLKSARSVMSELEIKRAMRNEN